MKLGGEPRRSLSRGLPRRERTHADAEARGPRPVGLHDVRVVARRGEPRAQRLGGLARLVGADLDGESAVPPGGRRAARGRHVAPLRRVGPRRLGPLDARRPGRPGGRRRRERCRQLLIERQRRHRLGSARAPVALVLPGLGGHGARGETEREARPDVGRHDPEHESGAEHTEAAEDQEERPREGAVSAPQRSHMLSGALTPSNSRPFRITRPTPAHSASLACISRRSSWMTRWVL